MALGQLAGLEQHQRVVGQLEEPDQVRDRRPAAPDAAGELLFGEPEVLDQRRAGARLVDRIEVLADDVLDQRHLQPLGPLGLADDRRHLLEAGLLGRAPAALAGDQLVAAVGEGADEQRLDDAAGLDRRRQAAERLGVEALARLVRVRLDQVDSAARGARRRRPPAASGRIAARPRPIPAASHGPTTSSASAR